MGPTLRNPGLIGQGGAQASDFLESTQKLYVPPGPPMIGLKL